MDIFNNEDYKYISNFVEAKIAKLRNIEKYNNIYLKNSSLTEELEKTLNEEQKNKLNEIIKSTYDLEEFYLALSYSLGVKYGKDLENL